MSGKDALESAAHVAEVLIALVAVYPAIAKAFYLLTHAPAMSETQRRERIKLMLGDRMGGFQRAWVLFVEWCRSSGPEFLTWRESRAAHFLCPMQGHRFVDHCRPASLFQARCKNCRALYTVETQEQLDGCERRGRQLFGSRRFRYRSTDS